MPSTRPSRKQPEQIPDIFVDRSVGRILVPQALREMGFTVHTLWEVYGPQREQDLGDGEWISDSADNGWVCLTRDELRIHRETILRSGARIFRLGRAARTATDQIAWIRTNLSRIERAARGPRPYVYVIRERTIERVLPGRPRRGYAPLVAGFASPLGPDLQGRASEAGWLPASGRSRRSGACAGGCPLPVGLPG